ncbi:synaptonemal complex central element protein 2 [Pimephales promelas]|uniref:synaptonemal complex central element protein 2 n=1 Tax=Pimephales promelas TaxID=90988 RepID=UPI0019555CED|nr:synaptonemal complex central element protein 2 [Pimephales promelas]XP_039518735.1 synaptonemal complex central element protein 2 [Pimephales promelas]KAG1931460.1 synaptonemal complex central element protein [Pimephales promelas]
MAQHFFGNSGSMTLQSTPKLSHHHVSAKVPDDGLNSSGETLSFVTLNDSSEQQSEDSGIGVSNTSIRSSPINSTMEDVGVLSPINSGIDEIGKKAHDLIERINERRAMDQHEMNSFEEKLIKKVSEMCQRVKEEMFEYYEQHSQVMEASIAELSEVLERSSQLSMELQGASQTLAAINKGLQHNTEQ